jgi:hypothetical protein
MIFLEKLQQKKLLYDADETTKPGFALEKSGGCLSTLFICVYILKVSRSS